MWAAPGWMYMPTSRWRRADYVTIHCPRNPETIDLFDKARIAQMKTGAILVNTARGGIINEAALLEALNAGHVGGAGLDVYANEPVAPGRLRDHPLPAQPGNDRFVRQGPDRADEDGRDPGQHRPRRHHQRGGLAGSAERRPCGRRRAGCICQRAGGAGPTT